MTPSVSFIIGVGAVAVFVLMFLFWVIQAVTKNAGVIDIGWALGLFILTGIYGVLGWQYLPRAILIAFFVGVWAFRLSGLLLWRIIKTRDEDARYKLLRADWAPNINVKFFLLFEAEAVLALVLSTPFLLICLNPRPGWSPIEIFGVILWDVAFICELISDEQLRRFKANLDNRGKVCQTGFWYYSRHPNYFFEWVMWVAYAIMAMDAPYGWIGIVAPAIMLFLLLKVTGVPFAEMMSLRSRGDLYREYQRTTSIFVPRFKKKI